MSKALEGVRILDMSHVQAGPTCTQILAWFGADVIKVERPGVGDITRGQLQDVPKADSLYFTMLNHNKRSIALDTMQPKGNQGPGPRLKARAARGRPPRQPPQAQPGGGAPDQALRRAGRDLRARRARSHGLHVGAHPG